MRQMLVSLIAGVGMMYLSPSSHAASSTAKEPASKSCLARGSSAAKVNLEDSGLDVDMKIVEGPYGPEMQIGDIRLYMSPNSTVSSEGKQNTTWCLIDPKAKNKADKNSSSCVLIAPSGDTKQEPTKVTVMGSDGKSVNLEITAVKDTTIKGEPTKLVVKPAGSSGSYKNYLSLHGSVGTDGNQKQVNFEARSNNYASGQVSGVVESSMSGQLAQAEEKTGNAYFKTCQSKNEGSGQLRSSEDEVAKDAVSIVGSHIIMRGSEKYNIDQFNRDNYNNKSELAMANNQRGRGTQ